MNTLKSQPIEFFNRTIFFLNEEGGVGEATLKAFLNQYYQGDPARAWYVKEVTKDVPVWHNDEDGERETGFRNDSMDRTHFPDEYRSVTTWEVREGQYSNISRDRLIESFDTEVEAETHLLNGLYWNFCYSNRDNGAPYHADTKEEVEAEIEEIKRLEKENAY